MTEQNSCDSPGSSSKFRAIIIGAGPIGLVASHIFSQAGINFILLERRETIVPEHGAGIVAWPHTLRIMDQLGLLDGLRELGVSMDAVRVITRLGGQYNTQGLDKWRVIHGTQAMFFHRPELLRFLYTSLPSDVQQRLIPGKTVMDIQTIPDGKGVTVTCADGTIEKGDIVVGADGVHSKVRKIIAQKRSLSEAESKPFVAKFRCLFGYTTHLLPGLKFKDIWEAHTAGTSTQVFVFADKVLFMVYQRLTHATTSDESESGSAQGDAGEKQGRYTQADQDEFIKQTGGLYIASSEVGLRVENLYKARQWAVLSDSHEGIMEHWHAGGTERLVLVGDAVNKQTPNFGHGWNCGVQDVVVLANTLVDMLKEKGGEGVGEDDLGRVFIEYQGMRYGASKTCLEASMTVARMHAWDSWRLWFLDRWVAPVVSDGVWLKIYLKLLGPGPQVANGYVLDFLREKERPKGLVPWVKIPRVEMEESARGME